MVNGASEAGENGGRDAPPTNGGDWPWWSPLRRLDEPAYPPHSQGSWWPGDVVIGELAGCLQMIHLSYSRGSGHFPESLILVETY